ALFSPSLASAPNDWSMPLNFAPAGSNFIAPTGVAIDSSGHVWVTNYTGDTVTALNNDGTLLGNFAPAGSNFTAPTGVAIDSSGNVWAANTGANTVTALNNAGTLLGNFAPSGSNFSQPFGVAIDSLDQGLGDERKRRQRNRPERRREPVGQLCPLRVEL